MKNRYRVKESSVESAGERRLAKRLKYKRIKLNKSISAKAKEDEEGIAAIIR